MHQAIFNMVTFGRGSWTYESLYNMPVFLRNYYIQKMSAVLDRESSAAPRQTMRKSPKTIVPSGGANLEK